MEDSSINPVYDGQEGAVGPQATDEAGESTPQDGGSGDAGRNGQSRSYNQAMKAARLQGRAEAEKEAMRKARETAQAEAKRTIDEAFAGSGMVNPYTKKPITSKEEYDSYKARFDAERKTKILRDSGMSEEEFDAFIGALPEVRQARAVQAEAERERERSREQERIRAFVEQDIGDFARKYPDIDPARLEQDERFRRFAKGRLYREPLADILDDYREFSTETERAALARRDSKADRSTGAGGTAKDVTLTADEEKALEEWNARYPELKMNRREWKQR